jgi:hypothetical protein
MITHPTFPTHVEVHRSQIPLARVRVKIVPEFNGLCDECPSRDCAGTDYTTRGCSTSADGFIWVSRDTLAKFVLEGVDFKTDNPDWARDVNAFLPIANQTQKAG